jgi:sporulation-control protein spo0M
MDLWKNGAARPYLGETLSEDLRRLAMGFFDKIKGAVKAVTGGAAKVTIEYPQHAVFPGDSILVKITATSTGAELKSKGIFVDLRSTEEVRLRKGDSNIDDEVTASKTIFNQEIQIAPAFVLPPNETKLFEGQVQIPNGQPSYNGAFTTHEWSIRGRVEAFGNDPDSGYLQLRVGSKQ